MKKIGRKLLSMLICLFFAAGSVCISARAVMNGIDTWQLSNYLTASESDLGGTNVTENSSAKWTFSNPNTITATVAADSTASNSQSESTLTLTAIADGSISISTRITADDQYGQLYQVIYDDTIIFDSNDFGFVPPNNEELSVFTKNDMKAGDTVALYVQSPRNGSTALTIQVSFTPVASDIRTIALPAVANGSYTVGDIEVSNTAGFYTYGSGDVALSASPAANYIFTTWKDQTGRVVSYDQTATVNLGSSENLEVTELYPTFIPANTTKVFHGVAKGRDYYTWNDAFGDSEETTIALIQNKYSLPTTMSENFLSEEGGLLVKKNGSRIMYSIPSNKTLLLPYATEQYSIADSTVTGDVNSVRLIYANAAYTAVSSASTTPYNENIYLSMTIPKDATVDVSGGAKVVVGGTVNSSALAHSLATRGQHSNLQVTGMLHLQEGAILSSCGYVYGTGEIIADSGAELYQPFTILDYRGGGYTGATDGIASKASGESKVTPFIRYTMRNIQTKLYMDSGAKMYGYCDLYTGGNDLVSEQHNVHTAMIIGGSADVALLMLSSNAMLEASYDSSKAVDGVGRTTLIITGGATLGELNLNVTVSGLIKTNVSTGSMNFPIPYNYDIYLEGDDTGAVYNIPNPMSVLPGASITVGENAALNITGSRFMVFDGLCDQTNNGTSATTSQMVWGSVENSTTYNENGPGGYPTTAELQANGYSNGTGNLIVNGTLNIGGNVSFGGLIQTEGEGGRIIVASNATMSCSAQIGLIGYKYLIKYYVFSGATVRTLEAQIYQYNESDGSAEKKALEAGKTYYGRLDEGTITEYNFQHYPKISLKMGFGIPRETVSALENKSVKLSIPTQGSWDTTNNLRIVNADGSIKGTYATLTEALGSYSSGDGSYVQLLHSYSEDAVKASQDIYLDLNGKTPYMLTNYARSGKLNMNGNTLYGMDSKTDGYVLGEGNDAPGSITVSGTVAPVTKFTGKQNVSGDTATLHRYLDVADGSTHTFHRFNISVTDYYLEVLSTGAARIGFGSTFRGDSKVIEALTDMGFTINSNSAWAGKPNLGTIKDQYNLYYTVDTMNMGDNTAIALVKFGESTEWESDEKTVNFLSALKTYYGNKEDERQRAIIDKFMTAKKYTWPEA